MAVIGKNIIENLTTAMYENSNIIYREYIQNSADQIDKAIKQGIISKNEALIDIDINTKQRCITIYDNATGISKHLFAQTLSSIADSDKDRSEDKGFRGIGRLGGLACCDTLIFTSSYIGEKTKSIMVWDAKKLREIINDTNQRPTASELVDAVTSYSEDTCDEKEHFFEVKIIDVIAENEELLDEKSVIGYLQAVAPVPYITGFMFKNHIYNYAQSENLKIDEYKVLVNGNQLFKGYTSKLYEGTQDSKNVYDSLTDLEFRKIEDDNGVLLAWMWFGVSKYEKQIPVINEMRGIRLRKENIQVGNAETLSYPKFFKEPRGNCYFVGEVFAVHKDLIPNARRDYFNINTVCRIFENKLKPVFYTEFYKLYHYANNVKKAFEHTAKYTEMQNEFNEKLQTVGFIDDEDKEIAVKELEKQKSIAEKKTRELELRDNDADNNPVYRRVFNTLQSQYKTEEVDITLPDPKDQSKKYITQGLSKLNKKEQKLISKVYAIIKAILPKDMSEMVVTKIQEELNK